VKTTVDGGLIWTSCSNPNRSAGCLKGTLMTAPAKAAHRLLSLEMHPPFSAEI
jgi:hypothetical protein